ncbi:conserved exported protein of unknown function [Magnetospirillum gryphiswaldense MSR-1 v2]|uniref:Copper chaperone PCu(A)C n=1 Tax=Magnetospirillum gryphiswaldense (strain DSM 6361 / JCM 21280 / NBRC 15271 / MSR-1) TaxID=431944 RepID=V6EZJ3_MAGGM|nr:copper chaperone PCu(A)C [Magnetospirillum gryphiswaldense]CDK97461.1 conserved exported protein of unknown function [Magnetospirillum gryphiswaldense MSR-1 v2]
MGRAAFLIAALLVLAWPVWAGDSVIAVEKPWARATAGQAANGAAYLTLVGQESGDRLLSAASPVAETVELHTHLEEDGIMRMRPVESIAVPAGGRVELKPGGLHIMLIGLKAPLKEGRRFPLSLTFERAGRIEAEIPVVAAGARGGG